MSLHVNFLTQTSACINHCNLLRFNLAFDRLDWVSNYEKNRWFLVLRVAPASATELESLLQCSNEVADAFDQPTLYKVSTLTTAEEKLKIKQEQDSMGARNTMSRGADHERSGINDAPFHVSIAWSLARPVGATSFGLEAVGTQLRGLELQVVDLKVKIGNDVTSIVLASNHGARKHSMFE